MKIIVRLYLASTLFMSIQSSQETNVVSDPSHQEDYPMVLSQEEQMIINGITALVNENNKIIAQRAHWRGIPEPRPEDYQSTFRFSWETENGQIYMIDSTSDPCTLLTNIKNYLIEHDLILTDPAKIEALEEAGRISFLPIDNCLIFE